MATPPRQRVDPLNWQTPIVGPDGKPTLQFIQFWERIFGNDQNSQVEIAEIEAILPTKADKSTLIIAGTGLDGGGDLSADRTLDLADTAVTPDTYGDATNVPQITVDQQGRITNVVDVPITGGGGGGGSVSWSNGIGHRDAVIAATATGGSSGVPSRSLQAEPLNNFFWSTGSATKTLVFEFPREIIVDAVDIRQSTNTANGTWTIAGSLDGVSYTNIITDFVWGGASYSFEAAVPGAGFYYLREFTNTTQYKFYRFTLNGGSSTSNVPFVQWFGFRCEPL